MKKTFSLIIAICLLLSAIVIPSAFAAEKETIRYPFMVTMNPAEERKEVEKAINELIGDKLNLNVELVGVEFAAWGSQLQLMMTDGAIDVCGLSFMPPLATLVDNGMLSELDDLLEEYGQGIMEKVGNFISTCQIDGETYGVPRVSAYGQRLVYMMRKDLVEAAGLELHDMKDMQEFTEFLKEVKKAYPDLAVMPCGKNGDYQTPFLVDALGTGTVLAGIPLGSNDTTVVNYFDTPAFEEALALVKTWDENGFFLSDPLNAQDGSVAQVSNGVAFGVMLRYADASICTNSQQNSMDYDLISINVGDGPFVTTDALTSGVYGIPSTSKHKEAAMRFLNELFVNADLANLVCSGIEGKHYVVLDNGTIDFYGDLNAVTTGWPSGMGTAWPNVTLSRPWAPNPPDLYQQWLETNDACIKSPAFGFVFDSSKVSNEIAACTNIVSQYQAALLLNIGNQDELLKEFRKKLHDSGIDEIVQEKQRQLDEYLASKQ